MKIRTILLVLLLCAANHATSDDSLEKRISFAESLTMVDYWSKMMHKNMDVVFDSMVSKSELSNAKESLLLDFKNDYMKAVDKHFSEDSISYTLAFHMASAFSMEELKNTKEFYETPIGRKVQENLRKRKVAIYGMSKEEKEQLILLHKKYGVISMLTKLPEVMKSWEVSLHEKINGLRAEYKSLEASYILKSKNY